MPVTENGDSPSPLFYYCGIKIRKQFLFVNICRVGWKGKRVYMRDNCSWTIRSICTAISSCARTYAVYSYKHMTLSLPNAFQQCAHTAGRSHFDRDKSRSEQIFYNMFWMYVHIYIDTYSQFNITRQKVVQFHHHCHRIVKRCVIGIGTFQLMAKISFKIVLALVIAF